MNELLSALKTVVETALGDTYTYYIGKVAIPSQSNLPLVTFYPISMNQSHSGTVKDRVEYEIAIEVFLNMKQYFDNENGEGQENETVEALVNIVEDRETDGDAKANTLVNLINSNINLTDTVLYTDNINVEYEPYYDTGEFPVAKVLVTFSAHHLVNRT